VIHHNVQRRQTTEPVTAAGRPMSHVIYLYTSRQVV